MTVPLRPDAAARRALAVAALDALEQLRERRARAGLHTPADAELIERARSAPPRAGTDPRVVLDRYVRFAQAGWDKTAGGNLSYVPNGALEAGVIGALLAAGAHAFTGASMEAPAMVAMEQGVLRWMADLVQLPAGAGGILLSGGSLANQAAIVTARTRAQAGGTERDDGTLRLYASEHVHHSVTKAAMLAGLPQDAVRLVAADAHGRCRPDALDMAMTSDRREGLRPFLVVGVAGATDTGAIDPLDRLAEIAAGHHAWFHVDAAYGGFFALTERGRGRMEGIGRADSVTMDAHKGLFLPYGVGALLVRDPSALAAAHEGWGAYLRGVPRLHGLPNPFSLGPELTRPNRAPLVWFPLQLHGTAAFASELDRMLDLAVAAHRGLTATPGVQVGPSPDLSIVTFRATAGDAATDAVVEALHATGRFQISTTTLDGRATIRFAFLSPATTAAILDDALGVVRSAVAATAP